MKKEQKIEITRVSNEALAQVIAKLFREHKEMQNGIKKDKRCCIKSDD